MLYPKAGGIRRSGLRPGADLGDASYRNDFERDYARILHSPAFRRLTGKTQLFPSEESDFFRNRLTHSLEVAQVASAIARRLNATHKYFKSNQISERLCELAALAHDIGHPPFGHNGEEALHHLMNGSGGFEGNAQTIRILAKMEKKEFMGENLENLLGADYLGNIYDNRLGLDLCARSLAAVLKYDNVISPTKSPDDGVVKGYYYDDMDVINFIKAHLPEPEAGVPFKTIECSIMDIADDIAYSTYDLEDAFKAGFLDPLKMLSADTKFKDDVASVVRMRAKRYYPELEKKWKSFGASDVDSVIQDVFDDALGLDETTLDAMAKSEFRGQVALASTAVYRETSLWAENGYYRTGLTSALISRFVNGVRVHESGKDAIFWNARLKFEDFLCVEVLKTYAYKSLIMSSFLRLSEYRGRDMIEAIYNALMGEKGILMMPTDYRMLCEFIDSRPYKHRIVCDFIASMTDRYAIDFYRRLIGAAPPTIFKPY